MAVDVAGFALDSHCDLFFCACKMSASKAVETVSKPEEKRKIIPTEKAIINKIESIQKERKRKVDEIKQLILSLKELMKDEKNVSLVSCLTMLLLCMTL